MVLIKKYAIVIVVLMLVSHVLLVQCAHHVDVVQEAAAKDYSGEEKEPLLLQHADFCAIDEELGSPRLVSAKSEFLSTRFFRSLYTHASSLFASLVNRHDSIDQSLASELCAHTVTFDGDYQEGKLFASKLVPGAMLVRDDYAVEFIMRFRDSKNDQEAQADDKLYNAVRHNSPLVVEWLLVLRADPNEREKLWGRTPLFAVKDPLIVEMLIGAQADVNVLDQSKHTPLRHVLYEDYHSSHHGKNVDATVVQALINHKANVDIEDIRLCKSALVMDALLQSDGGITMVGEDGKTVLHVAADCSEVLDYLLHNGAHQYIESKDKHERTALHDCAFYTKEDTSCLLMLLEAKAQVDARDDRGLTPLHLTNSVAAIRALCEWKADIEARDADGETPLHVAALSSAAGSVDPMGVKELLSQGANVEAVNGNGDTVLQAIAKSYDERILECEKRKRIIRDEAKKRYTQILSMLIAAGAQPFDMSSIQSDEVRAFIEQEFTKERA